MNLEERIKAGMLFYESGHVDPVNQEIEERLENERKDCKELMFDYNHCRPGDQDLQLNPGGVPDFLQQLSPGQYHSLMVQKE